ncbi:MAG TPA: DNA-directed RNA polymerase subunit beta [Candidatus Limnocylindrales bacterium]|nr:DNA-directed RNA polymerase subunit beta [Candidatus Limnocylindrales bacterium]
MTHNFRLRRNFGKLRRVLDVPNLIDIQRRSYEAFLQAEAHPEQRSNTGLQGVFKSVFPIKDFTGTAQLDFVSYAIGDPKYDVAECHQRGMTYSAPLKVTVQLVTWDVDPDTSAKTLKDIKEQEVYFGELPLMTENGTFMVNGTERVIVSQLHRSPGVFFDHDKGRTSAGGRLLFNARIIPYRGSWLDFEFDAKDILYVRIDRRRKFPATVLLRALGMTTEELLNYFYPVDHIRIDGRKAFKKFKRETLEGQKAGRDIRHPHSDEILVREGRKFTRKALRDMAEAGIDEIPISFDEIIGGIPAHDIVDPGTGEVIVEVNGTIKAEQFDIMRDRGINEFHLIYIDELNRGPSLRNTLLLDKIERSEDAIVDIYRRLRPGDPPTLDTATAFFNDLFFNADKYDLSPVGRLKLNHKLGIDVPLEQGTLRREDILRVVNYLILLKNGIGSIDDIDHLGNRRVRTVGELVENQYRIGLLRMERAIRERMSLQDLETLMPQELINYKPVSAVIKEFFGSSQLSQFMDQTNPLSEVTHKRRLSALGPGGLTRERAGFDVRDVHPTHYGRVCPIETPEGPNIGLISSLSTFARINEFGFVETPYRKVVSGTVTDNVDYLTALAEEAEVIAQANAPIDDSNSYTNDLVAARKKGISPQGEQTMDSTMVPPDQITMMDVSPNQLVSVAAALIPFLEHDDANRALMGSNMQRQAVPLLRTDAPLVGTGMESIVARDSGVTCVARRPGAIESVDSERIVVKADRAAGPHDPGVDIYNLTKYQRSNQNTCINQKPIVLVGERVDAGDVIADGPSTECGDLALGRNVVVAFMPWNGYNFEDSILVSERLVKEDYFTSVHIEEFECVARDTKLGPEEITRDIPNVGEEALKDLDEAGIIRIGAEVGPGDILVGKITPKGETQLSPEEKLLRAIFGEKAGEVRDTSLRMPPGTEGTVIDARVFSRKGVAKDERATRIDEEQRRKLEKDRGDELRIIRTNAISSILELLGDRPTQTRLTDDTRNVLLAKDAVVDRETLVKIPSAYWAEIKVGDEKAEEELARIVDAMNSKSHAINAQFDAKIERLSAGDELAPGVIKMVKVFVAIKRRLQVGDKMAGRHGNKGVVSKIVPEEDMPFLEDGTPVEICLNPLGVPSRMNVGQILETHLGWAAKRLGAIMWDLAQKNDFDALRERMRRSYEGAGVSSFVDGLDEHDLRVLAEKARRGIHISTPVFDGASEEEIFGLIELANLPESGQAYLRDGKTGDRFDMPVTVGVMYMLKLHHLVDDKIHARSTGPYSLVTQQPLGGKAQFGGQRLGEMEVWALEAYGAAYTLQEMLTVKSDDVAGRTRMYEAIVKNENTLEPGLPESFNVMVKELQSLALDVQLVEGQEEAA